MNNPKTRSQCTYKCFPHSHFVQLQELLHRQVSRFLLKSKKTTVPRVFLVFFPEKKGHKKEKIQEKAAAPNEVYAASLPSEPLGCHQRFPRAGAAPIGSEAEGSPGTHRGSSSGSQPSSSLRQKKHCATSGLFSLGQCTKPAAAICRHMGGRQRPPGPAPPPTAPAPRSPARACRRSPR